MSISDTTTSTDHQVSTVVVIEPDEITRNSLIFLFESVGLNVHTCPSGEDFLTEPTDPNYACLITEIALPGIDGLALIKKLTQLNIQIPTIMLTQQNDVSMAVHAIHSGAVDFIEKPFVEPMLLDRVMQILAEDSQTGDNR